MAQTDCVYLHYRSFNCRQHFCVDVFFAFVSAMFAFDLGVSVFDSFMTVVLTILPFLDWGLEFLLGPVGMSQISAISIFDGSVFGAFCDALTLDQTTCMQWSALRQMVAFFRPLCYAPLLFFLSLVSLRLTSF